MDRLDRLILNAIQSDFPVDPRPYRVLARRLSEQGDSYTEEGIQARVSALKRNGFIRRLGAVFNAAALGYHSTLCAARVPEDRLELFARLANQAPQVTHNYLRSGDLNIWFTFTAGRPGELSEFLERLKRDSGVDEIHVLESERLFKIRVHFDFS